jgi:hypothetical protein
MSSTLSLREGTRKIGVGNRIFHWLALPHYKDGGAVGSTLEKLHFGKVVNPGDSQVFAALRFEFSEALAGAAGLKDGLRNDEPEFTAVF